jgi:hypothetical protein
MPQIGCHKGSGYCIRTGTVVRQAMAQFTSVPCSVRVGPPCWLRCAPWHDRCWPLGTMLPRAVARQFSRVHKRASGVPNLHLTFDYIHMKLEHASTSCKVHVHHSNVFDSVVTPWFDRVFYSRNQLNRVDLPRDHGHNHGVFPCREAPGTAPRSKTGKSHFLPR